MFIFGNMNDQQDRLTQYVPMSSISECLKEKRLLARDEEFKKDAFCGEALVEMKDGVKSGAFSLRGAVEILEHQTGRKLSPMGLKKIIDRDSFEKPKGLLSRNDETV